MKYEGDKNNSWAQIKTFNTIIRMKSSPANEYDTNKTFYSDNEIDSFRISNKSFIVTKKFVSNLKALHTLRPLHYPAENPSLRRSG